MNIAAAMAALGIRDLELTAKMAALVVACRADRDTLGGVPLGRVADDLGRHPGHLARVIKAVDGTYLYVDNSVIFLGSYFEVRAPMRAPARGAQFFRNSGEIDLAELEAGPSGDNAAAVAALADARASLSAVLDARLDRRRRR